MHLRGPNNAATHRVSPYRLSREHVTHAEAIAELLARAPREGDAPSNTSAATRAAVGGTARDAVVAHVAHCSDCWQALADLDVPDAAERVEMSSHFGCDAVRDDLFALVDLDPDAAVSELDARRLRARGHGLAAAHRRCGHGGTEYERVRHLDEPGGRAAEANDEAADGLADLRADLEPARYGGELALDRDELREAGAARVAPREMTRGRRMVASDGARVEIDERE